MKTTLRVLVILVILAAGGAAAYWFLVRGRGVADVYRLLGLGRGDVRRADSRLRQHRDHRSPDRLQDPRPRRAAAVRRRPDGQAGRRGGRAGHGRSSVQRGPAAGGGADRRGRAGRVAGRLAAGGNRGGRSGLGEGRPRLGRSGGRLAAAGDCRRRGGRRRRRRRHGPLAGRLPPGHVAVPAEDDLGRRVRRRPSRLRRGRRKTSPGRRATETCQGRLSQGADRAGPLGAWPRPRPSTIWSRPARARKTSTRAARG